LEVTDDLDVPVVGLTGRRAEGSQLDAPAAFSDSPVDAYFSDYARSVLTAGGLPVHLPQDVDPHVAASFMDALLLSGGHDVDPVRYGASVGPRTTPIDPARDAFEIGLVQAMISLGKPVLGICRGAQVINVATGGSLVADLPVGAGVSHASFAYPRAYRRHEVHFEPDSLARRIYGHATRVNSFHHQAVDGPGVGIRVAGRASDGVVEAIEHVDAPVLGLQWHPECFESDPAFGWLVATARQVRDFARQIASTQIRQHTGQEAAV
jgi:putative glutamine amidotransferase